MFGFGLFTIIALAAFVLCLACVVLNALFAFKGKAPLIPLIGFGVTFVAFALTGAVAVGLNVPVLSGLAGGGGSADEAEPDPNRFILREEQLGEDRIGSISTGNLELLYGELRSIANNGEGSVEIKVKIRPQKKKGMSILQNFLNVEDLIKLHGFDICKEIKYSAVAGLRDGGEARVISFTLNEEVIQEAAAGTLNAEGIQNHADPLWISNGLQD